jgi:hypothetical protein
MELLFGSDFHPLNQILHPLLQISALSAQPLMGMRQLQPEWLPAGSTVSGATAQSIGLLQEGLYLLYLPMARLAACKDAPLSHSLKHARLSYHT